MLSVASNSGKMASTRGTASLIAAMITSTCSRPSVAAAASLSWRTTSQHSTHNGTLTASSARSVYVSSQVSAETVYLQIMLQYARSSITSPKYTKVPKLLHIQDIGFLMYHLPHRTAKRLSKANLSMPWKESRYAPNASESMRMNKG